MEPFWPYKERRYLSSVDSLTIRRAFWLLSMSLHLCASNCA